MDLLTGTEGRVVPLAACQTKPLLQIAVRVYYGKQQVLRDLRLDLQPGEALGLVGASGSGKSTLSLAILGLLGLKGGRVEGSIQFAGQELTSFGERQMRHIRGNRIALVPQSPLAALNPALTLGTQYREAWLAHSTDRNGWRARLSVLLPSLSLNQDARLLDRYPRELSVGMAQRALIGMSVLHQPDLLIADEPTSALDAITRADVIELFARLNREHQMAILCISHDLGSVATLCRRIAILHEGEIVECDVTERIFGSPQHPFTQRLIAALPFGRQ